MAHITTTHGVTHGLSGVVRKWLHDLNAERRAYVEYRRTIRELSRLGDRELADIGLARCDIEEAARYHLDLHR
ncbi:MAG: DUF1127 domain-containing protein [Marinibacterium sp.]|nr:DUF1127 domain-containing protein [Marinibacterium sp.]